MCDELYTVVDLQKKQEKIYMEKHKKRVSSIVAMVVVLCSVFLTFRQVLAANTNLTTWGITAYTGESRFGSNGRKKDNSNPLYVKYTTGNTSFVDVGAYGSSSYNGTYIDLTYPDEELSWKRVYKNNSVYLSSYVYETFGSQAYAKIKICVGATGSYMGSWAPDTN